MADEETGTGIDPVLAVLIAQLLDRGILTGEDIADMARRMHESDLGGHAMALYGIVLSCEIDTPENRRAAIHAISDGGNCAD